MHQADHSHPTRFFEDYRAARTRLHRCAELRKAGYYENAVALAMQFPELLPECARLVSLAPNTLEKLTEETRQQFQAELIEDAYVEALQEAFDVAGRLTPLNDQLRRLVLIRALAPSKLQVMRRILAIEPSHPFMEADIRATEQAWFREIPEYVSQFSRDRNEAAIRELADDLVNSNYLEPVLPSLIALLEKAIRNLQHKQLPVLEAEVLRCFDAEDFAAVVTAFGELDQLLFEISHPAEDISPRVAEARRWMKKRQREIDYEQEKIESRERLSRMIQDRKCQQADLEIAHAKAAAMGMVDEHLEQQYQARLMSSSRSRQGNYFAIAVSVLLLITMVPTVIYFLGQHWAHEAALEGAIAKVKSGPLAEEDYVEALAEIDSLPEELRHTAEMVAFRESVIQDRNRHEAFQKLLADIEAADKAIFAESDIDLLIAAAEEKRLIAAEHRDRVDAAKIARLDRNRMSIDLEKAKLIGWSEELSDRVAQVAAQLHPGEDQMAIEKQFEALRQDANVVLSKSEDLKLMLGTEADEILERAETEIDSVWSKFEAIARYWKFVESLDASVTSEELNRLLQEYQHFHPEIQNLDENLRQVYLSIAIVTNDLAVNQEPPAEHAQTFQTIPQFRDGYRFCREELQHAAARTNFTRLLGQWQSKGQYIVDVWMYRDPEGVENHHYFDDEPAPGKVGPAPLNGADVPSSRFAIPNGVLTFKAPQSLFADEAIPKLEAVEPATWHQTYGDVYEQLRAGERESKIDPICRLLMLHQIIQAGRFGSGSLNDFFGASKEVQACEEMVNEWNKTSIPRWILNDSWSGNGQFKKFRKQASEIVAALPSIDWQTHKTADEVRFQEVSHVFRITEICTQCKGKFAPLPFEPVQEVEGSRHFVLNPTDPSQAIDLADSGNAARHELEYLPVITVLPQLSLKGN